MIAPKLRFSEFKDDWFKNKIGDFIINHVGGASFTPNDFVKESNFEVIPKKAIMSGGKLILDKENPTFSSEDFYQNNLKNTIDKSYLVTTLRDLVPSGPSIGYIVSFDDNKKYILAQGVYGFRIKDDLNRNFLIQFSNTSKFRTIMQSKMVGSTQVHIRNQDYFDTEIYKPCLEEQTKIAEFLSAVDDKINQLNRQLELLNQYKKGVMQKIFSQEIRFKNDNGEDFGEWDEKELNEIFDFSRGEPLSKNDLDEQGQYDCIHYGELFTKYNEVANRIYSKTNKKANKIGKKGYILMPSSDVTPDGLARATCLNKDEVYLGGDINVLKPKTEINSIFFSYLINSDKSRLLTCVAGTTVKHIYNKDICGLIYNFPSSIQEQEKIAGFLTAIDERIDHTTAQLTHTKQWKKGLLQQMFV